ncbi:hypothetical protein ACR782_03640 [Sphingobacterium spiritivorum]|uniref:hypothetical protein n=1 Tax=Sphingobacterium spiritivorum TaxID=258 RepID=UPI003DA4F17B
MKNLEHQTKQAFLFSLAFYVIGLLACFINIQFATLIISVSLLISLIWVFMVLREIFLSGRISNVERLGLAIFIVMGNILAGAVYFWFLRNRVIHSAVKNKFNK